MSHIKSEPDDDDRSFLPGVGMVPAGPSRGALPPVDRSRPYRRLEGIPGHRPPLSAIDRSRPYVPNRRGSTPLFVDSARPSRRNYEVDGPPYIDRYIPTRPELADEAAQDLLLLYCPGALTNSGEGWSPVEASSLTPSQHRLCQSNRLPLLPVGGKVGDNGGANGNGNVRANGGQGRGSPSDLSDSSDDDIGTTNNNNRGGRGRRPPRRSSRSPGFPYQSSSDPRRWLRDPEDGKDHYRARKSRLEEGAFDRNACIHHDRDKIRDGKLGRILTVKDSWSIWEGRRQPTNTCRCAISRECSNVPEDRKDHRTYAPNPKERREKRRFLDNIDRLDPYDPDRHRSPNADVRYFGILGDQIYANCTNLDQVHARLRKWISEMRVFDMRPVLRASNILTMLRRFFDWVHRNRIDHHRVPLDICFDLEWLSRRWRFPNGIDLDLTDCMRRIIVEEKDGITVRSLDKNPTWKRTANDWGHNSIVPGECWPYQICLVRDGAHGAMEGGIYGVVGQGATSIVLSDPTHRDDYADIDEGERLNYVSTASSDINRPTGATQLMLDAQTNEKDIRVFRSWRIVMHNKYRPVDGFRYDGLYLIKSSEVLDEKRRVYRFEMERLSAEKQGPIRTDRPDLLELRQFKAVRQATNRSRRRVRRRRMVGDARDQLAGAVFIEGDEGERGER